MVFDQLGMFSNCRPVNQSLAWHTIKSNRIMYLLKGQYMNVMSVCFQNPQPSILKLRRNVNNNWIVNITAQSSLKADVELFQYTSNRNIISLKGSPVLGRQIIIYD